VAPHPQQFARARIRHGSGDRRAGCSAWNGRQRLPCVTECIARQLDAFFLLRGLRERRTFTWVRGLAASSPPSLTAPRPNHPRSQVQRDSNRPSTPFADSRVKGPATRPDDTTRAQVRLRPAWRPS
jgi:hypothetical protein